MKNRVNTNLFRDSDFNFDRSKFLRMDANERIIPFSKEISLIKNQLITISYKLIQLLGQVWKIKFQKKKILTKIIYA